MTVARAGVPEGMGRDPARSDIMTIPRKPDVSRTIPGGLGIGELSLRPHWGKWKLKRDR